MHPIIFSELAQTFQHDLFEEVNQWRLVSQATEKKYDKIGVIHRIITGAVNLIINYPRNRDMKFPQFSDENVR